MSKIISPERVNFCLELKEFTKMAREKSGNFSKRELIKFNKELIK